MRKFLFLWINLDKAESLESKETINLGSYFWYHERLVVVGYKENKLISCICSFNAILFKTIFYRRAH